MREIFKDEPAFPRNYERDGHNGMSLRDYFAGQALAALPPHLREMQTDHRIKVAEWAYGMADAMLSARIL